MEGSDVKGAVGSELRSPRGMNVTCAVDLHPW